VIAHELGHFSRRHGRFGHWLYAAHMGWLWHAESIDSESTVIDRAGAAFAHMFAPPFSRRAMVWSRRCEYEADSVAARVVGGQYLVSALVRLGMFDEWEHRELPRTMRGWQRAEPRAPADYLDRVMTAFEKATPDLIAAAKPREATLAADWRDTHPPARERAAALDLRVEVQPRTEAGGPALLGPSWAEVAASFNGRWRKENALAWAVAHERTRLIDAPLIAADATIAAGWPLRQRLARARALRGIDPAAGLAELKALQALASDDDAITFALAAALLADDDAAGIAMMVGLATAEPTYRVPACLRLVRYYTRAGDRTEVERWDNQLEASGSQLMRTGAMASEGIASGEVVASTRPPAIMACLRAGMAEEPTVAKAWLLEGNAVLGTTKNPRAAAIHIDALLLIIDPKDAEGELVDTEAVKLRLRDELSDLIEPNALAVVTSFYSTEPTPQELQAALGRLSSEVAYVRRSIAHVNGC
jgi:Peptidase family M48